MTEPEIHDNLVMLKYFIETEKDNNWQDYCNAIEGVLNLIEKKQQEIEDLKEKHKTTKQMNKNLIEVVKDSISKDKIRTKIKELRKKEDKIYKLNYELEPEKAIDSLLLRIGDLEELLEEDK